MSMTDPIADLLSRIRNAQIAKHDRLDVPASKLKLEVVKLLKDEGFIKNFREIEGVPVGTLRVFLRYTQEGIPAISHLERVSKPGRRVYTRSTDLKPILNGLGISIISTSRGVISDREARQRNLGGEVLCEVW